MLTEQSKEGCQLVVFQWSTEHGKCFDCGLPAAFKLKDYPTWDPETLKRCSVCAANEAVYGESIERIDEHWDDW